MKSHMRVRALCEGAVLVAVAQILSYLKLWEMPWGGSVVLSMIPLVLYAVRWGLGAGLLGGFAFGVLQFMFDGGFAIGWQSIVGDYLVAFTVLGLAGLVARRKSGVFTGTLIAGFSRFLVHYVVGATVWAEYMPETFFGMTMHSPWFYSLLYNLAYMLPNIAITLLVFAVAYKPLKKYFTASDLLPSPAAAQPVKDPTSPNGILSAERSPLPRLTQQAPPEWVGLFHIGQQYRLQTHQAGALYRPAANTVLPFLIQIVQPYRRITLSKLIADLRRRICHQPFISLFAILHTHKTP